MKLYLTIIFIAMGIISVINIAAETATWYYVIIAVVWCTALQFALDGLVAIVINKMPDKWFGTDSKLYNVSERERRFYKRLNVRVWKDRV